MHPFLLTLFESSLTNLSISVERSVSALFLVLTGRLGILFGISNLMRKEDKRWVAVISIALNVLFAG